MKLENVRGFRGNLVNVSRKRNREVSRKHCLHTAVALFIVFCLMVFTAGQAFGQAPPFRPVVYAGTNTGWLYRIFFDPTQCVVEWTVSGLSPVECVAASRYGDYVAVGTTNSISLFTASGTQLWSIPKGVTHRQLVEQSQVAISENGNYIVVAHKDKTVRLYDLVGIELWCSNFDAKSVAITWDGLHVFAGGPGGVAYYNEGTNRWDPSDGTSPVWTDTSFAALTVAISEDTNFPIYMVAGGDRNSLVKLYKNTSPPPLPLVWTYRSPRGTLMSVDINSTGTHVIAGNDDPSNRVGAQLDVFDHMTDGIPGWLPADGIPVWTYIPSTSTHADCRAVDFGAWPSGVEFVSGGAAGYAIYKHSATSPTPNPLWTGTLPPAREVESIDLLNVDDSWIVSSDTGFPEVLIWTTWMAPPLYIVPTNGNVMSVSASAFSTNITATGGIIINVPDEDQPPFSMSTDWCAPTAAINVLDYWDRVMGWAPGLLDGWWRSLASDYLGWFMDTNNAGSPARGNPPPPHRGTYHKDVWPGINEYAAWSPLGNPFPVPFIPPMSKVSYIYTGAVDYFMGFPYIVSEINFGRPLITSFAYWNLDSTNETLVTVVSLIEPEISETVHFYEWGPPVGGSGYPDPEEKWEDDPNPEFGIGHAVTCVGYIWNFDPDGPDGPLRLDNWVIVHDNWPTTRVNVALPWNTKDGFVNWRKSVSVQNFQ